MNPSRCGSCSSSTIIFHDDEMNDDDVGLTLLSAFYRTCFKIYRYKFNIYVCDCFIGFSNTSFYQTRYDPLILFAYYNFELLLLINF
jgi:hypothetical protein